MSGPARRRARIRLSDEGGFTLIEVLVAIIVLVVGLLGAFATLDAAAHTTRTNRQRQAETSLAREVIEDARSLAYTQLTPTALPTALESMVTGSTVVDDRLVVTRSIYSFSVALDVCSLDDPTDGYGNHSSPPASGGKWCDDVAPSGTVDSNPDDEKRLSVTVTPSTGSEPTVQLATLIDGHTVNGPVVSCLTIAGSGCPGANASYTSPGTTSVTFAVTTTAQASAIKWSVNGDAPPSAQVATGASDPYVPPGTTSQFQWVIPSINGVAVDGTYTISAAAQDSNGATGSRSTLQITVNEHDAVAPTSVVAGYDALIAGYQSPTGGVDIQWLPSTDQDVLYYDVYRQTGSTVSEVCTDINGTSCTDLTAPDPGPPPSSCTTPPTDDTSTPSLYWVVGVDKDSAGNPRVSSQKSPTADADLCDQQPSPPSNLTTTTASGAVTLSWTAPAQTGGILGWRVYRWASGANMSDPDDRLAYVGMANGTPTFTDSSPDPNGVTQNYCVTSVDTQLNESPCSNAVTQ